MCPAHMLDPAFAEGGRGVIVPGGRLVLQVHLCLATKPVLAPVSSVS